MVDAYIGFTPFQVLEITDGTTTVNFLDEHSGFFVTDWSQMTAPVKNDGVWADSPLVDGRKLKMKRRGNVVQTWEVQARSWNPDALIRDTRNLRQLLNKAAAYSPTSWQREPVWIKRQGLLEENPTYALIEDYRAEADGYPFSNQDNFWNALGQSAMPDWSLVIEHEPFWRNAPPGEGVCVQASGLQEGWEYDDWELHDAGPVGDVWDIIETLAGTLIACESNSDVWLSADGSAPWVAATTPPAPAVECRSMIESAGYVYLVGLDTVTTRLECWRSADNGDNWVQRTNDITALAASSIVKNGLAAFNDALIVATNHGVYRSTNGGTNWAQVLATNTQTACYVWRGYAYTSDTYGHIFRSADGITWVSVANIAPFDSILAFASIGDILVGSARNPAGGAFGPYLYGSPDGVEWGFLVNIGILSLGVDIDAGCSSDYLMIGSGLFAGDTVYRSFNGIDWRAIYDFPVDPRSILGCYSGNSRAYVGANGAIYIGPTFPTPLGRSATCDDEIFTANKSNRAQLTEIFIYDASGPTYTDQFPATVLPFDLLPSPFAAGDMVYFCIDSSIDDSGPFCSLAFDIGDDAQATAATTIWEYSQGGAAWGTLNVNDETESDIAFGMTDVNGVYWVPPDDWATDTVNGVTGLWVRLRVTALGAWTQSPTQQNRDVYTVNWPDVDIDGAQVGGDVPALLRIRAHNRSDEDGYDTVDELDLMTNRLVVGLRSSDRGERFTTFLNLAEDGVVANTYSQNPIGVTVTDGTGTTTVADNRAPCGIVCVHTTTGNGIDSYDDVATIEFGPSIARDYYGEFHVFLRAQLEDNAITPVGDHDDVRVRLRYRTGSGGVERTTDFKKFIGRDANGEHYKDFQLIDFGRVTLPVSGQFSADELPDEFTITVQIASVASTNLDVVLYDLNLTPVDEWSGDFVDAALEDDSAVTNGYLLDVDSVMYPKSSLRSLVRTADASAFIRSVYERRGLAPAILQANADQQLFFLSALGVVKGADTAGTGATTLTDSYADFIDAGVKPGMIAYNATTGNSARITAVAQTILTTDTVVGGWNITDEYFVVCPNWRSDPSVVHSIQLEHVARYESMRGAD